MFEHPANATQKAIRLEWNGPSLSLSRQPDQGEVRRRPLSAMSALLQIADHHRGSRGEIAAIRRGHLDRRIGGRDNPHAIAASRRAR
jgi:hypothetical protein